MHPLLSRWQRFRQSSLHVVAANSAWLIAERLVRAALGIVVGAWVARYLGPAGYGTLAYVASYVMLFMPIATLNADAIVVRNITQQPGEAAPTLGSVLACRAVCGLALWGASVAGMALLAPGGQTVMLTAVVGGLLLFQAVDVIDLWFQSQSQSRRTVAARLVAAVTTAGVRVGLIMAEAPLEAFALATLLEAMLAAAALSVAYRRLPTGQHWKATAVHARGVLKEAWPYVLSGVAIMAYARVDQLLIKEILGPGDLGIYAAATSLSQFWPMIPMAVAASIAPFFARLKQGDPQRFEQRVMLAFRAFFYAGVLSSAVTVSVSGWVVPLLFGPAYAAAVRILDLHVLSNIFCFLGIAHGVWLVNERRFAVRLWGTIAGVVATLSITLTLLPSLGLVAACLAAIAAQAIAGFLINALLDRRGFLLQIEAITFIRIRA